MTATVYPYRKSEQIKKYISQFMRVFRGFQYDSGDGLKQIPIVYSDMERVAASILTKRDAFTNGKIPMFGAYVTGIELDTENKRSPRHLDSIPNLTKSPDDRLVTNRLIGPAYIMNMSLTLYASSNSELYQILEQILLVFNPRITIHVDSSALNSDYLSEIILRSIQPEVQVPMATERRVVSVELLFELPVRLTYPKLETDNIIKQIKANIIDETSDYILSEIEINEDDV